MGRVKAEVKAIREALFNAGQYFCNKCQQVKPLPQFPKGSEKARHMFGVVPQCKECAYGYVKQWAKENPESGRKAALAHKRRSIAQNPEEFYTKARELDRARFLSDPEKRRATNRRSNKKNALRRHLSEVARKRSINGGLTPSQVRDVFSFYGKLCLCCGSEANICIDHIVPLSRGGDHEVWNIQPLCVSCNSSKGARRSTDYRPDKGTNFPKVFQCLMNS